MASNLDEYYAERDKEQAQTADALNREKESLAKIDQLKINSQLEAAYREAGGIDTTEDEAYQAIRNYVNLDLVDGQVVVRDRQGNIERNTDGTVKSVDQKLAELKRTEGFKGCFAGDGGDPQENSNSPQPEKRTYTAEEARAGKVNIEDIAFGRIVLEGVDETRKPDTKVVDVAKLADLKKRKWD
jgi:hypothetical protein